MTLAVWNCHSRKVSPPPRVRETKRSPRQILPKQYLPGVQTPAKLPLSGGTKSFPGLFCVGGLARPGRRGRQSFRKGAVSCPLSHLPSNSSESRENPSLRPSEAAWLRSGQDGGLVCQKDNKFASGEPPRRLQFSVPCDTISSTYRRAVCFPRSRSSLSAF